MIERLGHIAFARRDVPAGVAAALTRERLQTALARRRLTVDEAAVLLTCERVEIYLCAAPHVLRAGVSLMDRAGRGRARSRGRGRRTVEHLHRVAAGLESRRVGECHVLGQVRRVDTGPWLQGLFRSATRTGRAVRRETALGRLARSCVDETLSRLDDLPRGAAVAVIGGGRLARELHGRLTDRGRAVTILVRRPDQVTAWAGPSRVRALSELARTLPGVAAVVAATASPVPLVTAGVLTGAAVRPRLIDLGEPPNIADDLDAIRLDDLATRGRTPSSVYAAAEAIVGTAVDRYTATPGRRRAG